jgi:hypothetical protein
LGTGIGSNDWKDADVVFLFDEFFIPRSIAAANVQGLREHEAHEGDLGKMTTLNSKAPGVDVIAEGHRLRWTKQLALRGRARSYDEHGMCGKQRLVVACELKSFMANVGKLFPGANVHIAGANDGAKWIERVLEALNHCEAPMLTTAELGELLNKPWREISRNVLTPEFVSALEGMGWRYVPGKGRRMGWFERKVAQEALAA